MNSIGVFLREIRSYRGETLHQVAKGVDIDSPLLSKIERGSRLPTTAQIKRISSYFSLSEIELNTMLVSERIIKEFGINQITYLAIKRIEKEYFGLKERANDDSY
ncbi:helix-turn-helix domain-containing protein [Dysgonomonas sp. 25]|uniref:helix-turn-helix domain-containing protein n=1 Tax=Dysgonomonas sp. 25 TaxID=2302933 RepID=UPI0013D55EF7|nr:helix-turn-helix transcriptional regulator [Dysgonomonas sp. 25]NDV67487.1 XRE family transcriptional regulator [Dysgonomonas sp. 25]